MAQYRYLVPMITKRIMVIEDLRNGVILEIPLSEFRLDPASGEYRERHLVAEHKGYKVSIPIYMELDRDGHIDSAKENLKTAIRILETENPLKSVSCRSTG